MFDKLKSALGSLAKIATHTTLSQEDIDSFLWDFEVALIESDVASEVIESLNSNLRKKLVGLKIPRSDDREKFVLNELKQAIRETFSKTRQVNLLQLAKQKAAQNKKDYSGAFCGSVPGNQWSGKNNFRCKVCATARKE